MKRIVELLVVPLLSLSLVLPAGAVSFADVEATHPAARAVDLLTDRKILSGINYDRFGGELEFNRFQMAESLKTLLGTREIPNTLIILLSDILPNSPHYQTVTPILQANLMSPMDNGRFEGLRYITRYEFADSLQRFLSYVSATPPLGREKKITFRDVKPDYQQAVEQFTNLWQITEGYPNGQFRGENRVTRYEAAIMLGKVASLLYEDIKDELSKVPPAPIEPEKTPVPMSSGSSSLEQLLGSPLPSAAPSLKPSPVPSVIKPTTAPSVKPSPVPSTKPSSTPSTKPTATPTVKPSGVPSAKPTGDSRLSDLENLLNGSKPSVAPTPKASSSLNPNQLQNLESLFGSAKPSVSPTIVPTINPSSAPTATPTVKPSATPSAKPTVKPSVKPSAKPSVKPSSKPSAKPTVKPSAKPSAKPSVKPTVKPSTAPTAKPSTDPRALIAPTPQPSVNSALSELERQFSQLRSTPSPVQSVSSKPAQTDSLVQVPLPSAQATPTPQAIITPGALPTPTVMPVIPKTTALKSRILLFGNYRPLYEERVPPSIMTALNMSASNQTISGDAGLSGNLHGLFWFGEPHTLGGNIGLALDIASMGGYTFNGANLNDVIWAGGGLLYRVVSSPSFDLALGLNGYYRYTDSSNDPRNNYFQAARNYIGAGARIMAAYRIIEPLSLELTLAPHYVMQDLANIDLPAQLPLNRVDAQIQFLINWDMFKIGNSSVSLDLGYQGLLLFDLGSEASQMMHGGILGLGYHF